MHVGGRGRQDVYDKRNERREGERDVGDYELGSRFVVKWLDCSVRLNFFFFFLFLMSGMEMEFLFRCAC